MFYDRDKPFYQSVSRHYLSLAVLTTELDLQTSLRIQSSWMVVHTPLPSIVRPVHHAVVNSPFRCSLSGTQIPWAKAGVC
jgi:hypothetical protein